MNATPDEVDIFLTVLFSVLGLLGVTGLVISLRGVDPNAPSKEIPLTAENNYYIAPTYND